MNHFVYKIQNKINGKYYIGRSGKRIRFYQHKKALNKNKHICIYLQRAWNKYGENEFEFLVVKDNLTEQEAIDLEQYYLDNKRSELYNMSYTSTGGDLISNHPNKEEIKKRIIEATRRRYAKMSKEEIMKIHSRPGETNSMFGKTHSKEVREKISQKAKAYFENNDNYRKGKTFEELFGEEQAREMRENLSEIASQRTGEKNPFYGKKHSAETKEKIAKSKMGKKPVNQRPVIIDGVEYISATEASRQLGVVPATILHRIKSNNPKYSGYFYKN